MHLASVQQFGSVLQFGSVHSSGTMSARREQKKIDRQKDADQMAIEKQRLKDIEELPARVAKGDAERARKRRKDAVAEEKARPKRSGELRLRLKGTKSDTTCITGLAESFHGFSLLRELDMQSVVDIVMEQEVTLEHRFVHVADFRFAGLRSAASL